MTGVQTCALPISGLVDQFFNDSTGEGEHGEIDTRGPWNEGGDWVFVQAPALQEMTDQSDGATIQAQSSDIAASDTVQELLVDQLRDLLHAEKQLLKALPKMVESARFAQLKNLFELHSSWLARGRTGSCSWYRRGMSEDWRRSLGRTG